MAGGDSNEVDQFKLKQFICLGTEGNTWKASFPVTIGDDNIIKKLLDEEKGVSAMRVISPLVSKESPISIESTAYALALCHHSRFYVVRNVTKPVISDFLKSSLPMFTFVQYNEKVSSPHTGWSRSFRKLMSDWYNCKSAKDLAVEVTKTKSSHNWNHKDVLCLAHVKAKTPEIAVVLKFIIKGIVEAEKECGDSTEAQEVLAYLKAVHELKHTLDNHVAARLIEKHDLCFEQVPIRLLKSKEIWTCLVPRLKMPTLLKQLTRLHKLGFLKLNSQLLNLLLERLKDENALNDTELGPFETFLPVRQWEASNKLVPGKNVIRHNLPQLDEALLNLFHSSFNQLKPTNKRYVVAVDVRASMAHSHAYGCSCMSPADVTAIILMALCRVEMSNLTALAFSTDSLVPIDINSTMSLKDVSEQIKKIPIGPVNLALPLKWALQKKEKVDVFIILTDTLATLSDCVDPTAVLKEYRESQNHPNARFITCALGSPDFTSASCDDINMLDIAGFNVNLLRIIQNFASGVF